MPGVWTPAEGLCGLVGVVMTLTMRQQKAWFWFWLGPSGWLGEVQGQAGKGGGRGRLVKLKGTCSSCIDIGCVTVRVSLDANTTTGVVLGLGGDGISKCPNTAII